MKYTKIIITLLLSISIIIPVNAGFVSKGVKTGLTIGFFRFAAPAIMRGTGKRAAGWALKKLKSKSFTHFTESMAILTFIAVGNEKYKDNIKYIMDKAGVLTNDLSLKIDEDSKEFSKAKSLFTSKADDIDKKYKKQKCDTYKLLLTKAGYPSNTKYIHSPVREWDVGSYKLLLENSIENDDLQHDHIPSKQSIVNFLNKKGFSVKKNNRKVLMNGTALEVTTQIHMDGATYGGKQNSKINDIKRQLFDSQNLRIATIRDMSYHYINSKANTNVIKSFFPLYKRNLDLCLYN